MDNRQDLTLKFMQRHHAWKPEEQEVLVQAICSSIPENVRVNLPEDPWEAAAAYYDTWLEANRDYTFEKPEAEAPKAESEKKKVTAPVAPFTSEQRDAAEDFLAADYENVSRRTNATHLVNILTDQPVFGTTIVPGAKLIPKMSKEQIDKLKSKDCVSEDDKKKRDEMIAQAEAKTEMEVYINSKAKQKVIGYRVNTLDDSMQPVVLDKTKDEMLVFLGLKVRGYIPNTKDSLGAKITQPKRKNSENNEASGTVNKFNVTLLNRNILQSNPNIQICTSDFVRGEDGNLVEITKSAKSADYFSAYTEHVNSKNEKRQMKCRISGETKVYRVERLNEFVVKFNTLHRDKDVYVVPTKEEEMKFRDIKIKMILGKNDIVSDELAAITHKVKRQVDTRKKSDM